MNNKQGVLEELGLTMAQVSQLRGHDRSRLLNFLRRWRCLAALHACLDVLIPLNPSLVSLRDLRARAFLAQGKPDQALPVVQKRLQLGTSLPARALLARIHLAREDVEAAAQVAHTLVKEREESAMAWNLMGKVELARGDTEAATKKYRHLSELYPNSRAYLLGMVTICRADDDWVAASGYAVRLLRLAEEGHTLSVTYLRRLRDYFQVSGEKTRVADLEADLKRRYASELTELREHLSPTQNKPAASRPTPAPRQVQQAQERHLPTFDEIPVSDAEQKQITQAAQRLFGFESLLPGQLESMACILRGEDILTVLPTGGGKSLCYQLPAMLAERGVTLVISPLIALMKDQVDSLPKGMQGRATTINSSLERDALRWRLEQITDGGYRLVYAAPERLRQPAFLHALRCAGVDRLVIDEAHCVSVWGHDFRPDYLTIGQARQALGDPPLLAMTATAPPHVRRDILKHLKASSARPESKMRIISGDATRPNLQLEVFHAHAVDDKLRRLVAFCKAESGSGIIYAGTRARCEELAALLQQNDVNAVHYHAGIQNRTEVQEDFMAGRDRVVVATIAFGLGIDKANIRFILHFVPSNSLEAYYQEAGRAGRDGLPSRCLLMYSSYDRGTLTRRANQNAIKVEFLRDTYAAVKNRLKECSSGPIAAADLERDLRADRTHIRVALSLLEEVSLLRRGPDLPRTATVRLTISRAPANASELTAFCRAARLRPSQSLNLNLGEVARQAEISLDKVEQRLLEWAEAGWLNYHSAGRDMTLELLPPPEDAADRVARLLERYETVQAQRVDEIAAYAQTNRCRHDYLSAYLGGRAIEQCETCDNCIAIPPPSDAGLPNEREQLSTILQCVSNAPWSWGRFTLMRILRGDGKAHHGKRPLHEKARAQDRFGALAFRSKTAVKHMIERLEYGNFLKTHSLDHGGVVLKLTPLGEAALQDTAALDELVAPM